MRTTLLGLTLLGSLIALFGATAPAASAAYCNNVSTLPIVRYESQGYQVMGFQARVLGCVQVRAIQWKWSGSGFRDYTEGNVFHQAYLGGTQSDYTWWNPGSGAVADYAQTCWYPAGALHVLRSTFRYRLLDSVYGTWSSIHTYTRPVDEGITC